MVNMDNVTFAVEDDDRLSWEWDGGDGCRFILSWRHGARAFRYGIYTPGRTRPSFVTVDSADFAIPPDADVRDVRALAESFISGWWPG